MSTIATSSAASMPHEHAHEEHHENNTVFGFWLYLMTDCLLFASFFATYAVLFMNTAGGVSGKDIFELNFVAVETAALLLSSITFGFAMICAHRQNKSGALAWLAVTWHWVRVLLVWRCTNFITLLSMATGRSKVRF